MKIREIKLGLAALGMCMLVGAGTMSVQASSLDGVSVSTGDVINELENVGATYTTGSYMPYSQASYSLEYRVVNGEVVITGYSGTAEGELVLPATIENYPVVAIAKEAFKNCSEFTGGLTIPGGVRTIEASAFYGCSGLNGELSLPSTLTYIGWYAFEDCSGLTGSLVIPEGITYIGRETFRNCSGFNGELVLPSALTYIDTQAFYQCKGFTGELKLPATLTYLGGSAFAGCEGFTGDLIIPEMESVSAKAFYDCSGFDGQLVIPDSVTAIGDWAFCGCENLTGALTLPANLQTIGAKAFKDCAGLTGELYIPDTVTTIGEYAFAYCSGFNGNLTLPSQLQRIEQFTFFKCSGLTGEIKIPDTVTMISVSAFEYCSGFEGKLIIPESVEKICQSAFRGCTGLNRHVFVSEKTTDINEYAFALPYVEGTHFMSSKIYGIVTIHAPKGSQAEALAKKYGYLYAEWNVGDVVEFSVNYGDVIYAGQSYLPIVSGVDLSELTWETSDKKVATVDDNGVITAHRVGTVDITATTDDQVVRTITINVQLPADGYIGNINTELLSLELKKNERGQYYLAGEIVIVEWVDGVSTVPADLPVITMKTGNDNEAMEVFLTPTGTNTYYFDRFINRSIIYNYYVFEVESGTANNYSYDRSIYVNLGTSPKVPAIKNLGKLDYLCLKYKAQSDGVLLFYTVGAPYEAHVNSELLKTELVKGPNGNYISGEIVVVEWESGVSTVPFETPIMYFKSVDGTESLPVFVTATGTNTYYFDRSIGELDVKKEYIFTVESGDSLNHSPYRSMVVTTAAMSEKEGLLWESDTQYVRYKTDSNSGELRIYAINK